MRVNVILILFIFMAAVISLLVGPANISFLEALRALVQGEGEVFVVVMREIRLPRLLLSLMIGFALGMAGAAMQGFLRNPLAEPGVIGISSAGALGAVIALQTGFAIEGGKLFEQSAGRFIASAYALPFSAMLGAVLAACLLLFFGRSEKAERLILVGIGISAISGALISLVLNLSPNPFAASEIMFWMMGSVAERSMIHVILAAPFICFGVIIILTQARALDALSLGEDTAQSLGTKVSTLGYLIVMAVTLMVGASVAVAGAIGFVGLVVPHMLRPIVGSKPSRLLIASGLGGASLLTFADILTRMIAPDRDIKLGVLTALIGAPLFLHLVISTQRKGS